MKRKKKIRWITGPALETVKALRGLQVGDEVLVGPGDITPHFDTRDLVSRDREFYLRYMPWATAYNYYTPRRSVRRAVVSRIDADDSSRTFFVTYHTRRYDSDWIYGENIVGWRHTEKKT